MIKNKDELGAIFNKNILPNISKLQTSLDNYNRVGIAFVISILMGFISLAILKNGMLFFIFLFITVAIFYLFMYHPDDNQSELDFYQKKVVKPLLDGLTIKLRYKPNLGISSKDILDATMINSSKKPIITSNNLITFSIDNILVKFANVNISVNDRENERNEIFTGLFSMSSTNREINGITQVSFDLAEKYLGFIGKGIQPRNNNFGLKRVNLDSSAFEKEFVVYSSDPIEANYLLTYTVMEKLTDLAHKNRFFITLTFNRDKLYVSLMNGFGFFQLEAVNFSKNMRSFKDIEHNIDAFYLAYEIIEMINFHHKH